MKEIGRIWTVARNEYHLLSLHNHFNVLFYFRDIDGDWNPRSWRGGDYTWHYTRTVIIIMIGGLYLALSTPSWLGIWSLKEIHRRQKEQAASLQSSFQTFVCPKCSKVCTSRIGLYSQRACKNWPSTFPRIPIYEEWANTLVCLS